MAPVAISPPFSKGPDQGYGSVGSIKSGAINDISRRPSPWHEIAHSLSATPVISRRASSPHVASTPAPIAVERPAETASGLLALSSSQALRDWEERLLSPESDVQRHQLVHPPPVVPTPTLQANLPRSITESPTLPPKLAAERDKEGHIEYKLKLIEPSPERFGRLVTQMMWRLKQGKNEAIYELGLADDGTVVGLTRAEMDASLRTLELMASEVGATVMILREIVLSAHPPPTPSSQFTGRSDVSSSAISLSSSTRSSNDGSDAYRWPVKRPDLDRHGLPRKGSKSLTGMTGLGYSKKLGKKTSRDYVKGQQQVRAGKQVIFDARDLADGETDEDESASIFAGAAIEAPRETSKTDDDIPPFDLDLDDPAQVIPAQTTTDTWQHVRDSKDRLSTFTTPGPSKKSEAKRLQSAKKREARRMDLLRGDGTNPLWAALRASQETSAMSESHPDDLSPSSTTRPPHQPTHPSSLRLASPAPDVQRNLDAPTIEDEEGAMWGLSHLPLDSLSLSFANVQIEDTSPPSSPSSDTEYAMPLHDDDSPDTIPSYIGNEMICVEALVVRKVQHGHGPDGDEADEEECGWGGEDDGWGFGVDDDD